MTPIPPELLARIDALEFDAKQVVEGYLAGRHRSPRHGFAVEFAQHREYAPGDDIKHLDWKVFGRTERYAIKQYEQETNLIAWLIVDGSESMRYSSGGRTKYEFASLAAAALGYLILQQTDSIGLAIYADRVERYLRPSARGTTHFRELLTLLSQGPTATAAQTGRSLDELAGRLGRRGVVFLFSDCLDDIPELLAGLQHLKFQKHEVIVVQVLDGAELEFPFRHPTEFRGLENLNLLKTDPLAIREQYLTRFNAHLSELETGCRNLEVDFLRLRTDADLSRELANYLQSRSSKL